MSAHTQASQAVPSDALKVLAAYVNASPSGMLPKNVANALADVREALAASPAAQSVAIGVVESAARGAGGFHVRLAPGAQQPARGDAVYTTPAATPVTKTGGAA